MLHEEPVPFLRESFPALFEQGVEILEARAERGDVQARAAVEDIRSASGASLFDLAGEGHVWLSFAEGRCTAGEREPAGAGLRLVLSTPPAAMSLAVRELAQEHQAAPEMVALRAARSVSRRVQEAIGDARLAGRLEVTDVPTLGTVAVLFGVGYSKVPAEPSFTVTTTHAELDAMRRGGADAQAAMFGGSMQFAGDYAPALSLAMQVLGALQR